VNAFKIGALYDVKAPEVRGPACCAILRRREPTRVNLTMPYERQYVSSKQNFPGLINYASTMGIVKPYRYTVQEVRGDK
jgi:hypothetical protein